ncbi:YceD family protein [Alkalibacter mobilis]|uniref:YceD family protein n=1 Tax=Alkalibacter mobilis TaxID=2787712 RepID=UPI00189F846D|nr:DUF177 domain-containing protein [Alkalibacter mobilis]MBF7095841.1 DUF177 domain-containing protein [Alkalibacter mobilis]
MNINIADLIKGHKIVQEIEFVLNSDVISDKNVAIVTPIKVKGTVSLLEDELHVAFNCSFRAKLNCSRCTALFERDFSIDFDEVLELSDIQKDGNENLDLTELIRDNIILNLPTKPLCKETCKGLCAVCGKDKNYNDCNCESEQFDPRLSVLNNLLNEDE